MPTVPNSGSTEKKGKRSLAPAYRRLSTLPSMKLNYLLFKSPLGVLCSTFLALGLYAAPAHATKPAIEPAIEAGSPATTAAPLLPVVAAEPSIQVVNVQLQPTSQGLDIRLDTAAGKLLTIDTRQFKVIGDALVAEISGAVLALPAGQPFEAANPSPGVTNVQISQLNATTIQIRVVGAGKPPTAEITLRNGGLAYSLNPSSSSDDEEITVVGTRTPRPTRLTPGSISGLDREDIQRELSRDLRDLLRYEPNVSVGNNRRYGLQDINIRGLGGNRVLILNDGIRIPTQFQFGTPSIGRDYVDLETLQRVEVIRGPASALYGSDALGGVVTFRTLEPGELLNRFNRQRTLSSLSVGVDTADRSFVGTALTAFRVDQLEGLLSYTRRDGNEARVPIDNQFTDNRSNQRNSALGKLVYTINSTSRLSFTADVFRNNDDFQVAPVTVAGLIGPRGFRGQDERLDYETNRDRFSFVYNFENPKGTGFLAAVRAQLYYQNATVNEIRIQDFGRDGTIPGPDVRRLRTLDNRFEDRVLGGDLQVQNRFQMGWVQHRLTYGLDASTTRNSRVRDGLENRFNAGGRLLQTTNLIGADNFPVKDFPDSDTLRLGAYVQNEMQLGRRFTLIPGLRFDYYQLTTRPDELYARNPGATAADFNASALSPSLGFVWQPTTELAVVGRYARGFRAPLYSEINAGFTNLTNPFFRYQTLSNPNLRPETSNTFELGVRGNFRQVSFSLTGFYNDYSNFIETFAPAGVSLTIVPGQPVNLFQSQNIARARTYGFELGSEFRFDRKPHGFSLLAAVGLTVGDDLTRNQPLESVEPIKAVLGLRYRAPENRWGTDLIATIVGRPRLGDDRPADSYTPVGYTSLDLIGYYNVNPQLSFNFGVFNLLNSQYFLYSDVRNLINAPAPADLPRFAQPGISFRAGVTWRF
jgi:hemoglobin/transferrin/lactoferrin receptor protein